MEISRKDMDNFIENLGNCRITYFDKYKVERLFKIVERPKPIRFKWDALPEHLPETKLAEFIRDNFKNHEDWQYYPYICSCFDLKMDKNFAPIFNENLQYKDLNPKAIWTLVIFRNVRCSFYEDFGNFHCEINVNLNNEVFDVCIKVGSGSILIDIFEDGDPRIDNKLNRSRIANEKRYEYSWLNVPFIPEEAEANKIIKNSKEIKKQLEFIISTIKKMNDYNECRIQ